MHFSAFLRIISDAFWTRTLGLCALAALFGVLLFKNDIVVFRDFQNFVVFRGLAWSVRRRAAVAKCSHNPPVEKCGLPPTAAAVS